MFGERESGIDVRGASKLHEYLGIDVRRRVLGGGFVDPEGPVHEHFIEWACSVTGSDHYWDALQALMYGERRLVWDGHRVEGRNIGYALVDAAAFHAVARLEDPATWAGGDFIPKALRQPVSVAPEVRPSDLRPSDLRQSGQYAGLAGKFGCAKVVQAARRRALGHHPGLMTAVDACEQRWS